MLRYAHELEHGAPFSFINCLVSIERIARFGLRALELALLVAACLPPSPAYPQSRRASALHEHVQLSLVKKTGTHFRHRGTAIGTVRGTVTSQITLDSLSLAGTVTLSARGGTLRLRINGTARSGGLRSRFEGRAKVVGGTVRYAHASGGGTFTGVVNRRTWAATIDASGMLKR
jgi:hypothetical protein